MDTPRLGRTALRVSRPCLGTICGELGRRPADVAIAWLLHRPEVTAPIVGPRTMGQLEDAIRAAALRLDEPTPARIDEIWPGPGGEAPEAYAW